jgi:pimeloyl-ACP methyl ester carboxylesterase
MATRDPSVVLLHASASSARQWQGLATALAPRFRVHAIDPTDTASERRGRASGR